MSLINLEVKIILTSSVGECEDVLWGLLFCVTWESWLTGLVWKSSNYDELAGYWFLDEFLSCLGSIIVLIHSSSGGTGNTVRLYYILIYTSPRYHHARHWLASHTFFLTSGRRVKGVKYCVVLSTFDWCTLKLYIIFSMLNLLKHTTRNNDFTWLESPEWSGGGLSLLRQQESSGWLRPSLCSVVGGREDEYGEVVGKCNLGKLWVSWNPVIIRL